MTTTTPPCRWSVGPPVGGSHRGRPRLDVTGLPTAELAGEREATPTRRPAQGRRLHRNAKSHVPDACTGPAVRSTLPPFRWSAARCRAASERSGRRASSDATLLRSVERAKTLPSGRWIDLQWVGNALARWRTMDVPRARMPGVCRHGARRTRAASTGLPVRFVFSGGKRRNGSGQYRRSACPTIVSPPVRR